MNVVVVDTVCTPGGIGSRQESVEHGSLNDITTTAPYTDNSVLWRHATAHPGTHTTVTSSVVTHARSRLSTHSVALCAICISFPTSSPSSSRACSRTGVRPFQLRDASTVLSLGRVATLSSVCGWVAECRLPEFVARCGVGVLGNPQIDVSRALDKSCESLILAACQRKRDRLTWMRGSGIFKFRWNISTHCVSVTDSS